MGFNEDMKKWTDSVEKDIEDFSGSSEEAEAAPIEEEAEAEE